MAQVSRRYPTGADVFNLTKGSRLILTSIVSGLEDFGWYLAQIAPHADYYEIFNMARGLDEVRDTVKFPLDSPIPNILLSVETDKDYGAFLLYKVQARGHRWTKEVHQKPRGHMLAELEHWQQLTETLEQARELHPFGGIPRGKRFTRVPIEVTDGLIHHLNYLRENGTTATEIKGDKLGSGLSKRRRSEIDECPEWRRYTGRIVDLLYENKFPDYIIPVEDPGLKIEMTDPFIFPEDANRRSLGRTSTPKPEKDVQRELAL